MAWPPAWCILLSRWSGGDESGYETCFVLYVFCGFTSDVGNNLLVAFSTVFTKVVWLHTVGQSLNSVLMGE